MFLLDIRCDAGLLATTALVQEWQVADAGSCDVPHLILVASGVDAAAIRAGTTPRAAAPVLMVSGTDSAAPPGVDEVIAPPASERDARAILDRWRPDASDTLARIEAALGTAAVRDMLLRLRDQLEAALHDDASAQRARRAHRLGGIAGMLGFTALGEAWLAVENDAPGAAERARIQTRLALAAIARRLY